MPEYIDPLMIRVRVRGGRAIHAVARDRQEVARTGCGSRRLRAVDHGQPDDAPVTCPDCRAMPGGPPVHPPEGVAAAYRPHPCGPAEQVTTHDSHGLPPGTVRVRRGDDTHLDVPAQHLDASPA